MNYLSVCAGIEAASAAWHPLGWQAVAFSEIDAFPSAVLAYHYPNVPNWGDMTRFKEWPNAAVDVLVGGTPCQSFSVAGLRKGLADPRGNLTLTYLAAADRYRPEWLVWENVPGVLSDATGAFGALLGGMAELGYGFAYRVLDAQFFGVAQRRRRVFVVGNARSWRRAAAVLFERASLRGDPAPSREPGQRPSRPIAGSSERSSGYRLDADRADDLIAFGGNNTAGAIDVAAGLNAKSTMRQDFETETFIIGALTSAGGHAYPDQTVQDAVSGQLIPVAFDPTQITNRDNRSNPQAQAGDPCYTLPVKGYAPTIAFSAKDHGGDAGELAPTLRGMGHDGSHANGGGQLAVAFNWQAAGNQTTLGANTLGANTLGANTTQAVAHAMRVRRLTPRECERLQGFPDDYTLVPYKRKPAKDGPRYKALGNSMAVPVMRWIGERIDQVAAISDAVEEAA